MKKMGKYCKAYQVKDFRQFSGWNGNAQNPGNDSEQIDAKEDEDKAELNDDDILYLQEDFTVTNGIFLQEGIVYDQVSPEWVDFCKDTLKFEIPVFEPVVIKEASEEEVTVLN